MDEKKSVWKKMTRDDLMLELGRYEKKVRDQAKITSELRAEIKEMREGVSQLNMIAGWIIDKVIDKYGRYGYSGEFIALPAETMEPSNYKVEPRKAGGLYILTRVPADKEKDE